MKTKTDQVTFERKRSYERYIEPCSKLLTINVEYPFLQSPGGAGGVVPDPEDGGDD